MSIVTRTTKAGNITRTIEIAPPNGGPLLATVVEQLGHKIDVQSYWLTRIRSQIGGMAFQLEKFDDGTIYDVLLNAPGGGHTCDCKWGSFKPNAKPCRHVEMCLQALRERKV